MALFMTSNNLTEEEVMRRGHELSFPDSVKGFFRGDLGQPHGGFPKELQKIVLKDEVPYTDRPNAHLAPIDMEKEFGDFKQRFDDPRMTFLDFLSYQLYPKVFEAYYAHFQSYDSVAKLPTRAFFYPMQPNEEILVRIAPGKKLLISYMYTLEPDEDGNRAVYFKINGQTRAIPVRDKRIQVQKVEHRKVRGSGDIGAPLQGKLTAILVEEGEEVRKNQPLFVIEAMKMESTITAPHAGVVKSLPLRAGVMVEQDDLVVEM